MKKIITLFFLFFNIVLMAQYEKEWIEVHKFELEDKIKTAYIEVENILKKARRKGDEAQMIKCFFYLAKFDLVLEDNAQTKIINQLQAEIKRAKPNSKALLQLVYAEILEKYFNYYSYTIESRTNSTIASDLKNFKTWTASDFNREISEAYSNLLISEANLIKTPLFEFREIIDIPSNMDSKNFSLYDFLAEKYLSYLKSKIKNTKHDVKISKQELDQIIYGETTFLNPIPVDLFENEKLNDILNLYLNIEKNYFFNTPEKTYWYQNERIDFFHKKVQNQDLYEKVKLILEKKSSVENFKQQLRSDRAFLYHQQSQKNSKKTRFEDALSLIDTILKTNINMNALANAESLRNQIHYKSLKINLTGQVYPGEPFRAIIEHKNIDSICIQYYRLPIEFQKTYNTDNIYNQRFYSNVRDSLINDFKSKHLPEKTIWKRLEIPQKYFPYTTEILMDPLEIGNYLIVINHNDESEEVLRKAYGFVTSTRMSIVEDDDPKHNNINVYDQKTGQPLKGVFIKQNNTSLHTNSSGKASIKKEKYVKGQKKDTALLLIYEMDSILYYHRNLHLETTNRRDSDDEDFEAKAMVYFDRAIYRPGQKVFFKGYLIQNKGGLKSVVPHVSVEITIEDPKYSELKKFVLQTNEFGSFSGEFDIPKNVQTGKFTFEVDEPDDYENDKKYYSKSKDEHRFWDEVDFNYNSFSFKVEEYKRPTFEINFDEITENYTLGDSIHIKGNAKALAGNSLTNAQVQYTISKNTFLKDSWHSNTFVKNVIIDETTTDAEGNFTISFESDKNKKDAEPTFDQITYTLDVEITDSQGETRTASSKVVVAKEMLKLALDLTSQLWIEDELNAKINGKTLNNYPIEAEGVIEIYALEQKNYLKTKRQFPEIQTIPRDVFEALFPYEPYEANFREAKEKLITTIPFNTRNTSEFSLDLLKEFSEKNFNIVAKAKDALGNEIETTTHISISSKKRFAPENTLFESRLMSELHEDILKFEVQSQITDIYVTGIFYDQSKTIIHKETKRLVDGIGSFSVPRKKAKIKMYAHFYSVWEKDYHRDEFEMELVNAEKPLEFDIIHYNNKLEPGSNETWTFQVKDQKQQSEILASMYDTSLDQFITDYWQNIQFYDDYNRPSFPFSKQQYPNALQAHFPTLNTYFYKFVQKYPTINYFGFEFIAQTNNQSQINYLEKIKDYASIPKDARVVTGYVMESEQPLPGATVLVKGTTRGTQTNFDGYFEIYVGPYEDIEISYIGMISKTINTGNAKEFQISLEEDVAMLSEVVLVAEGYRSTTRSKSASAVSVSSYTYITSELEYLESLKTFQGQVAGFDLVSGSGQPGEQSQVIIRGIGSTSGNTDPLFIIDGVPHSSESFRKINASDIMDISVLKDTEAINIYGNRGSNGVVIITTKESLKELTQVKTRSNFKETAFFFPHIRTDRSGKFSFTFDTPESLTRWKLRLFGLNKKGETGYFETTAITQKQLMVQTNMPRFFREKDTVVIRAKVANLTSESKEGLAILQLFDGMTGEEIKSVFINGEATKTFRCRPSESTPLEWKIFIPEGTQGIQYKIMAKSGSFSDGEENIVPVLNHSILVTESVPIWVKGNSKKEFSLPNLKNNTSRTLKHHQLVLEYSSNPVWSALQSLPYLIEFEHDCAEQVFSKYYANFMSAELLKSNPKIQELFKKWSEKQVSVSPLQKNEELKSVILSETPWLMDLQSEDKKNKRLALLMDTESLNKGLESSLKKMENNQHISGGFSWFGNGEPNVFITQHITSGIGHLMKLFPGNHERLWKIADHAISYMDNNFMTSNQEKKFRSQNTELHYLYARSFYLDSIPLPHKADSIAQLKLNNFKKEWTTLSLYQKALLSLTLNRFGDKESAKKIINGLKETALNNEDHGMYWIENKNSFYWYHSAIETQALLIEAFSEIDLDIKSINEMKAWLLKQKQIRHWHSTKATTEALYALLMQGSNWTEVKDQTTFSIGNEKTLTKKLSEKEKEAETGYIKLTWNKDEIKNEMGEVKIHNKSEVPGYGGLFWQYFEDLTSIKPDESNGFSIQKSLYKKNKIVGGEELIPLDETPLKVGDVVTVRLTISSREDVEFIHIKDLRASCMEPINVLSEHHWNAGLYYYQSTRDVATHFFLDILKKGNYVLDYDVRVNHSGRFSDGIATLQSMYAPEYTSHSNAKLIVVE
jgi:TonB-dependent SusC/RagA subfamily outer membrane receptor